MKNELLELTNAQRRIFVSENLFENTSVNNNVGYVLYDECLDMAILKQALKKAVQSMDCLNIRLKKVEGKVKQYFSSEVIDIEEYVFNDEKELQSHLDVFAKQVFKLYESSLIRIEILNITEEKCGYAINFHHLVSDGWTTKVFTEKVANIYESILNGVEETIEKNEYADYIEQEENYLKSAKAERHREILLSEINKYKNIENYTIGYNNAKGKRYSKLLSSEESKKINDIIESGISASVLFTAIFNLIIFYSKGKVPPFLSVPIYNRVNKKEKLTGGMFTSTMLIGLQINENMTLEEVLKGTKDSLRKAMKCQRYPYNVLYNELKNANKDIKELFFFSVNCYNMNLSTQINKVDGTYFELYQGYQAVSLQCIFKTWNKNENILSIDYREDCFTKQYVQNIYKFIFDFIDAYTSNREMSIKALSDSIRCTEMELQKNRVLNIDNFNVKSLSNQLETIIRCDSNKVAIYQNDKVITYGELQEYLNNTINELIELDLCFGSTIILIIENSLDYVIYALAALIVRSVIVPLDINVSEKRLQSIVQNCEADAIVSKKDYSHYSNLRWIYPHTEKVRNNNKLKLDNIFETYKDDNNNQSDIAYMIYTSGTTGKPKGVQIKRESIANYLSWAKPLYCSDESVFYMHSSPAFDLSITTLLLPYTSESSVVIDEINSSIHKMANSRFAYKINTIKATPSQLELLLAQDLDNISIEVIISGGEELTVTLAEKLTNQFGKKLRIYNEYGPTEATIGCMSYLYSHDDYLNKQVVPIGVPTPETRVYLVNDSQNVYGHEIGEIYLSGVQLSAGYKGLPDKNSESFVKMNFCNEILYKTGDLAYWNEDWQLEFIGRKESQNKVNGFRVEINSIENVIKNYKGVSNCIVEVDKTGDIDYIVAVVQTNSATEKDIRKHISSYLPEYYMPHYLFVVDNIPLCDSGKVDHSYINQLRLNIGKDKIAINNTSDEIKEILYKTCEEVLQSGMPIDGYNYYNAGGDSVKALLINAKIQDYGIQLSLADILMYPDIDEMAKKVSFGTYGKNNKALQTEFYLPNNIDYLKEDVPDFNKYIQYLSFKCERMYSEERIVSAWNKLLELFPILEYSYKNERIVLNQNKSSQSIKFVDMKNVDEKNINIFSELDEQNKLLQLVVLENNQELIFDFGLHHILADEYTWKVILEVFKKFLNEEKVNRFFNNNYDEFSKEQIYHYINEKEIANYSEYFCIKENVNVEMIATIDRKDTVIRNVLKTIREYDIFPQAQLLIEWDAREIKKFKKYSDTIGCFSVFLPISQDEYNNNIINSYLLSDQIQLSRGKKCIRLNYLGSLSELVPSGFTMISSSIENSLKQCAAFGCEAEITMYLQNDQLFMYFSSRKDNKQKIEEFSSKLKKLLEDNQSDDLVDLSDDEFESIFD